MDPTILNPAMRFARPDQRISRSPSHSPIRRQQLIKHELDPLLADLSPTSTLEALQSTDAVLAETGTHRRALKDSVAGVSTSERAWGIKAALAGKKVREWHTEIVAWPWPAASDVGLNGFKPRLTDELNGSEGASMETPGSGTGERVELEYWGSLPAQLVQEYEDRIEDIKDDMETLELEELKEHVRATHCLSGSKRSAYGRAENRDATYAHMDDFTAIITATTMQSLPHISRLHSLLSVWSTRLLVLRQVPGYLDCLEKAQVAMTSAWNTIGVPYSQTLGKKNGLDTETFTTIRNVLEHQVLELGQRLDCMLDTLEGRDDTLPDSWIDSMEELEVKFGTWVVEAERQVLGNEIKARTCKDKERSTNQDLGLRTQPYEPTESEEEAQRFSQSETPVDPQDGQGSSSGIEKNLSDHLEQNSDPLLEIDGPTDRGEETLYSPQNHEMPSNVPPDSAQYQSDRAGEVPLRLKKLLVSSSSATPVNPDLSPFSDSPDSSTQERRTDLPQNDSLENAIADSKPKSSHRDTSDTIRGRSSLRPIPLVLKNPRDSVVSNSASGFSSDVSFPGSSTSDYFSDMSSPEIQQASRAEYFGAPVEVTTPSLSQRDPISPTETMSRRSSQRTERGSRSKSMDFFSRGFASPASQRSSISSVIPESTIPGNGSLGDPKLMGRNSNMNHLRTRSASIQSTEFIPRNEVSNRPDLYEKIVPTALEVRNVTVEEDESMSTTSEALPKHGGFGAEHARQLDPFHTVQKLSHGAWVSQDAHHHYDNDQGHDILSSECSEGNSQDHPSLPQPSVFSTPHCPSNASPLPTKVRNRFEDVADLPPGSTPVKIRQRRKSDTSPHKPDSRVSSPAKNDAGQLEARISSILTEIPAHIRLTSGPELDAPEVKPAPSDPRTPLPRSKNAPRLTRAQTTTPLPSMTLAPAQPRSARSRHSGGESEIKLYHLHQAGKEAPVKLFIRLVGEGGERVMVRIGGGWADLGEYLKEYANHHGKRSVSDSRFAIQELPSSPITSSPVFGNGSAPNSRPGSSYGRADPIPTTPEALKSFEATPGSVDSLRPGSAHSWKDDESPLGGAGPKAKRVDVSPTKQAWVDGMLEQARHAATEKSRATGDFGNLGQVGATKRVYLRSKTAQ